MAQLPFLYLRSIEYFICDIFDSCSAITPWPSKRAQSHRVTTHCLSSLNSNGLSVDVHLFLPSSGPSFLIFNSEIVRRPWQNGWDRCTTGYTTKWKCWSFCVSKAILSHHISQLTTADDHPLIVSCEPCLPPAPPCMCSSTLGVGNPFRRESQKSHTFKNVFTREPYFLCSTYN